MDDTLIFTPSYASMFQYDSGKIDDLLETIKHFFLIMFTREITFKAIDDSIVVMNLHKTPIPSYYLDLISQKIIDIESNYKEDRVKREFGISRKTIRSMTSLLGEKNGKIIVKKIPSFHSDPDTIGKIINIPIVKEYLRAINKMIVTGRDTKLQSLIEERLKMLGLPYPDQGVHCFSPKDNSSIANFKASIISDSIKMNGWTEVHFYEDNQEWLDSTEKNIKELYPDIIFVKHHVVGNKV